MMAALLATRAEERRARFAELIETDARGAAAELVGTSRGRSRPGWSAASTAGRAAFSAQLRAIDSRAAVSELVRTLARAGDARPGARRGGGAARRGRRRTPATRSRGRARPGRRSSTRTSSSSTSSPRCGPAVERRFEARLASGEIDPALGLILAELQLLGDVEARINRFPDRHVAWYFTDILGQAPRPAVSARACCCASPPARRPVPIEAGAALVARSAGVAGGAALPAGRGAAGGAGPGRRRPHAALPPRPADLAAIGDGLRQRRQPRDAAHRRRRRAPAAVRRRRRRATSRWASPSRARCSRSPRAAGGSRSRLSLGRRQEAGAQRAVPGYRRGAAPAARRCAEAVAAVVLSDPGDHRAVRPRPARARRSTVIAGWVERAGRRDRPGAGAGDWCSTPACAPRRRPSRCRRSTAASSRRR